MLKLVRILSILLFSMTSFAANHAYAEAEVEPYTIYMFLWRGETDAERGFMQYFKEQNIPVNFVVKNANKDKSAIKAFIQEAKETKPDLIYTFGTTVSVLTAGKYDAESPEDHITDIPIVFNIVADPVSAKLTESLSGSKRNLTGTSHSVPITTQLNTIRSLDNYKKIGVIYNGLESNSASAVEDLKSICLDRNIELTVKEIPVLDGKPVVSEISDTVDSLVSEGVELVYLPSDSFIISNATSVVDAVHSHGIPTFSATEAPIKKGGAFIGVVGRYFNVGKFAGYKAMQILLENKSAGDIPIETLKRYTFLVNLDTAHKLAYYPPVTILDLAEVVEKESGQ